VKHYFLVEIESNDRRHVAAQAIGLNLARMVHDGFRGGARVAHFTDGLKEALRVIPVAPVDYDPAKGVAEQMRF